jgi:hypothetical protein
VFLGGRQNREYKSLKVQLKKVRRSGEPERGFFDNFWGFGLDIVQYMVYDYKIFILHI